jgi:hypothetical protein
MRGKILLEVLEYALSLARDLTPYLCATPPSRGKATRYRDGPMFRKEYHVKIPIRLNNRASLKIKTHGYV